MVCHFGPILTLVQRARGIPAAEAFAQAIAPLSLTVVRWEPDPRGRAGRSPALMGTARFVDGRAGCASLGSRPRENRMGYDLVIGDRAYSSWSLRGWLLFDAFGLPVATRSARLYTDELATILRDYPPARTVPALRLPDGTVVMESLAIAEELASRHPDAGHWPADPRARAVARSLAAEMHAGFQALRSQCPMNLRVAYDRGARGRRAPRRPRPAGDGSGTGRGRRPAPRGRGWRGAYSVADAFFAPVAARIATYGLPVSDRGAGLRRGAPRPPVVPPLARDGPRGRRRTRSSTAATSPRRPWPGPEPLPARAVEEGTPENAACPYSGQPRHAPPGGRGPRLRLLQRLLPRQDGGRPARLARLRGAACGR